MRFPKTALQVMGEFRFAKYVPFRALLMNSMRADK